MRALVTVLGLSAALLGCGGGGSAGGATEPHPTAGNGGSASAGGDTDPATRVRALVDDVVTLAKRSDCDAFGDAITTWIDGHRDEIARLIAAAVERDPQETLAELDAWVETHRLAVLEKAADCADAEDAWPAWQHFDATVDAVRPKSLD